MNRRAFLLASGALLAPLAAEAQQAAKPARIAVLAGGDPESTGYLVDAFKQGLRVLGYVEGKNTTYEIRWAMGKGERLPELAKELVALSPDIILTSGSTVVAAHNATTTIPIVVAGMGDPVGTGLVASLARPGGNITGPATLSADLGPKMLELLLTVNPTLTRLAVLVSPNSPSNAILANLRPAAQKANVKVFAMEAKSPAEIEAAFARMAREHSGAAIVLADSLFLKQRRQIGELASKFRIPSIFTSSDYLETGGLMSYGQNLAENFRRAAAYADKILKGARPRDLPIERAMTLEFVVSIKTAKALGITIPQSVLVRADRVIE